MTLKQVIYNINLRKQLFKNFIIIYNFILYSVKYIIIINIK